MGRPVEDMWKFLPEMEELESREDSMEGNGSRSLSVMLPWGS